MTTKGSPPQKKFSEMTPQQQQEHLKKLKQGLGEYYQTQGRKPPGQIPPGTVKRPERRRKPVSVAGGVITAGLIMAIASSSLPEGEGISGLTGLIALVVGFVVMLVLAKTIKL